MAIYRAQMMWRRYRPHRQQAGSYRFRGVFKRPFPSGPTMTNHNDILIVGAGILGLSHAYAAARRGLKVTVFERSATPLGASVRNFGQALVTGQPPGQMLDLAKASREIWGQWAQASGLQLKRNGSYLFARTEAEEHLLQAFCDGRAVE